MNRIDKFLNAAASQIGYYVKPGGVTKFGSWYGIPSGAWCAMFLSWAADQSGNADVFPKHAYTPSGAQWFKDRGQWTNGIGGVRRGDIVFFNFPDNVNRIQHVGVVESVNSDGSVNTIEGNTSAAGSQSNGGHAARKTRKSYIVGYGRPNWGAAGGAGLGARNYLQVGDSGPAVKAMQGNLLALGYSVGSYGADSVFGDGSFSGLVQFQIDFGLEPDGYYGPLSRSALEAEVARRSAPVVPRNADGSLRLETDGIRGVGHIGRWQEVMGTPIDHKIDKPKSTLIAADQRFLNTVVPPEHQRNLHGQSSLKDDGDEGFRTVIVRQFWLRNAVNPGHQQNLLGHLLDFDGINGPDTHTVHQFALNNATSGSGQYGRV